MTEDPLSALIHRQNAGEPAGLTSVCSAHPVVLASALAEGTRLGRPVLIEATCNQVNQEGGYTGLSPAGFRALVNGLAAEEGLDPGLLILGGDHLGPNPWRHLPAATAMDRAKAMVAAYVVAGFTKIHLDTSMPCRDDPSPLPETVIADRAATLAAVAEAQSAGQRLHYVIGTEVPVPGGATEHLDTLTVTSPTAAAETLRLHRDAFARHGVAAALDRIVALVVQPGVEFGHENVIAYAPEAASALSAARRDLGLVFEAHSTDYQTPAALAALVRDGFAILKVGPWLSFALRETLYGLDAIAAELTGTAPLRAGMEALMLARPEHWQSHYHGTPAEQRLQRHFSYSDRIRYYWADPAAQALVTELMAQLPPRLPETLISQYLAPAWPEVLSGRTESSPDALQRAAVARVLRVYGRACHGAAPQDP